MSGHDRFRAAAAVAFLLCYVTILLGGNVMASDSGLACPDWPTCHGSYLPSLQGPTGIEYTHRLAAFFLSVSILLLALLGIAYERGRPALRNLSLLSLGLVVAQALLGGVVVESNLVVGVVLLHLALATALFGLLLLLALLANLNQIPPRWAAWARRAAQETPEPPGTPFGAGAPLVPAAPDPGAEPSAP